MCNSTADDGGDGWFEDSAGWGDSDYGNEARFLGFGA